MSLPTIILALLFILLGVIAYAEGMYNTISKDLRKPYREKSIVFRYVIPAFYILFFAFFVAEYYY